MYNIHTHGQISSVLLTFLSLFGLRPPIFLLVVEIEALLKLVVELSEPVSVSPKVVLPPCQLFVSTKLMKTLPINKIQLYLMEI